MHYYVFLGERVPGREKQPSAGVLAAEQRKDKQHIRNGQVDGQSLDSDDDRGSLPSAKNDEYMFNCRYIISVKCSNDSNNSSSSRPQLD